MDRWEYQTTAASATDMNALGADGWRLVSVFAGMMFWERTIEPEPAAEAVAAARLPRK